MSKDLIIFDGLTYICTYSVEEFKELVHCEKLYVKAQPNTNLLYFTYGANIGFVSLKGMPKEPVISIYYSIVPFFKNLWHFRLECNACKSQQ